MVKQINSNQTAKVVQLTKEAQVEEENMQDVFFLLKDLIEREDITIRLILDSLYDVGSVNLINQKFRKRSLNRIMKLIARYSKPVFRIIALQWFRKNCPALITDWLRTKVKFEPAESVKEAAFATVDPTPVDSGTTDSTTTESAMKESAATKESAVKGSTVESSASANSTGIDPVVTNLTATDLTAANSAIVNSTAAVASGTETQLRSLAIIDSYSQEVQRLRTQVRWLTGLLIGVLLFLGGAVIFSRSSTPSNAVQSLQLRPSQYNQIADP